MSIRMLMNGQRKTAGSGTDLSWLSLDVARKVRAFHSSFGKHTATPLRSLPGLAASLGLAGILVKDESQRLDLNAFKFLGSSWAVGRLLAERSGREGEALTPGEYRALKGAESVTFITATDGNHGRGLARTAREFGCPCIVLMPEGSEHIRVKNILAEGADCRVMPMNYDACVRLCKKMAQEHDYVPVQDTDWEGYKDIPSLIMQGYTTMLLEVLEQLNESGNSITHCFLQAGVGSFAGALAGGLVAALGQSAPKCVVVEPHAADCHYQSALAADGKPHPTTGDLKSIMAGLSCGEPCTLSWAILRDHAEAFVTCPDFIAANGMRILAAPQKGDPPILSGESGAVGAGLLHYLMRRPLGRKAAAALGLGSNSTALLISTEGNTAPDIYTNIVWFGACPDPEV